VLSDRLLSWSRKDGFRVSGFFFGASPDALTAGVRMLPMTIQAKLSGCHGKTESVSILGQFMDENEAFSASHGVQEDCSCQFRPLAFI